MKRRQPAAALVALVCALLLALVAVLMLPLLPLPGTGAAAAELPWKRARKFERTVEQKDLRELLRELAGSYGISVVVDPSVSGTVTSRFDLTPQSALDYLASTYGLVWFYDGNVLNISSADSVVSEVIPLPAQNPQRTLRTLEQLGLVDARYPLTIDAGARVARAAGPKAYVDLVRNTLRAIDPDSANADEATVRVFRLRYAYAADQKVDGSADTLVPGLATVLSQLFPAQARPVRPMAAGGLSGRPKLVPVKGTNLQIPELPDPVAAIEASQGAGAAAANASANALPQFRADARLNALIVRDLPQRLAQYEDVIKSLDVKPLVVELEASIIEVSSDEFESLGLDWRFTSGRVDVQAGRALPALTPGGVLTSQGPPFGAGGVLGVPLASGAVASTVLGDSARQLLGRISALATQGKANVTSRPRLLTLDNVEAVIEDQQQFFVRVAAERDASLFQVNAGTSLRVRPLVVSEPGGRQLKLAIRIEDGAPTSSQVDAIPVVRRTSIGTWAYIQEGQSLLIGGFTQQQLQEIKTGVPGLSAIPVLGRLFSNTEKKQLQVERLFLLTPRIVEM